MPRFKNVSGNVLEVRGLRPYDTTRIEAGAHAEPVGEITDEIGDAYIVGEGGDTRAWPKAHWELDAPKKNPVKTADKPGDKES